MILVKDPQMLLEERVEALEKNLKALEAYVFSIDNKLRKAEIVRAEQGVEIVRLKTQLKSIEKGIEFIEEETT